MNVEAFVEELHRQNAKLLENLAPTQTLEPEARGDLSVANLLKIALRNEVEATELAARWVSSEADIEAKMAFARQAGDEAKHYRLILDRLGELGVDARALNPVEAGWSPLFHYLAGLETTVERVAAGQFTREAVAIVKNNQFIDFCEACGDARTAALYRDIIEPDERHHHELGRRLLYKFATSVTLQDKARYAARRTLQLADELQRKACETQGVHHAPGC